MSASWEMTWRQYRRGTITDSELVSAVIHGLQDADVATVVGALPEGYREALRLYVQSGKVPWGVYYFVGVTAEQSRHLHQDVLDHNRRAVEAIQAYFEANP